MESYVRTSSSSMEDKQSDPPAVELSSEPLWQLRPAGGGESYPEFSDQPDCVYYLKTGFCGYGARCRFNHPRNRSSMTIYPERIGRPVCQYYMRTGTCKFGASCKYHHPSGEEGGGNAGSLMFNISGYPFRQGEKECSYYVKTGNCKFGVTCKFHHPQPLQFPLVPGSYIQGAYSPVMFPSGVVSFQSFYPYQSYFSLPSAVDPSIGGQNGLALPLRSGQPECQYYMKTGDCKFGLSCRYNHPSEMGISNECVVLNSMGLPLRPGIPICSHYAQNKTCKFGTSCKFDHPMGNISLSQSHSISSLAEIPIGSSSSVGTLASSSSSSDMKTEIQTLSGINKDTTLSQCGSTAQASESALMPTSKGSEVKTSN